jgi:hypothetical protein
MQYLLMNYANEAGAQNAPQAQVDLRSGSYEVVPGAARRTTSSQGPTVAR